MAPHRGQTLQVTSRFPLAYLLSVLLGESVLFEDLLGMYLKWGEGFGLGIARFWALTGLAWFRLEFFSFGVARCRAWGLRSAKCSGPGVRVLTFLLQGSVVHGVLVPTWRVRAT